MLRRIRCLFGRHRRSPRAAHFDNGILRSRCDGCGTEMIKANWGWTTQREELERLRRRKKLKQRRSA